MLLNMLCYLYINICETPKNSEGAITLVTFHMLSYVSEPALIIGTKFPLEFSRPGCPYHYDIA